MKPADLISNLSIPIKSNFSALFRLYMLHSNLFIHHPRFRKRRRSETIEKNASIDIHVNVLKVIYILVTKNPYNKRMRKTRNEKAKQPNMNYSFVYFTMCRVWLWMEAVQYWIYICNHAHTESHNINSQ